MKITIDRAVVEQALEALHEIEWSNDTRWQSDRAATVIPAFRAALAEPVARPLREGEVMGAYIDFDRNTANKSWSNAEYLIRFGLFVSERTVTPPAPDPALVAALAEPQEPVESALQAVAEKIGDQCAVWYGIGARDVEEVLREAVRNGLVHGALAEPQEPETCTWQQDGDSDSGLYATSCRHYFNLEEGTPEDNKMAWCCYCGKKLAQELITEDEDE